MKTTLLLGKLSALDHEYQAYPQAKAHADTEDFLAFLKDKLKFNKPPFDARFRHEDIDEQLKQPRAISNYLLITCLCFFSGLMLHFALKLKIGFYTSEGFALLEVFKFLMENALLTLALSAILAFLGQSITFAQDYVIQFCKEQKQMCLKAQDYFDDPQVALQFKSLNPSYLKAYTTILNYFEVKAQGFEYVLKFSFACFIPLTFVLLLSPFAYFLVYLYGLIYFAVIIAYIENYSLIFKVKNLAQNYALSLIDLNDEREVVNCYLFSFEHFKAQANCPKRLYTNLKNFFRHSNPQVQGLFFKIPCLKHLASLCFLSLAGLTLNFVYGYKVGFILNSLIGLAFLTFYAWNLKRAYDLQKTIQENNQGFLDYLKELNTPQALSFAHACKRLFKVASLNYQLALKRALVSIMVFAVAVILSLILDFAVFEIIVLLLSLTFMQKQMLNLHDLHQAYEGAVLQAFSPFADNLNPRLWLRIWQYRFF